MPDGRVLVALSDGPLAASPTWTRLDDTDNLIAQIEISTGRQTELDRTDTGTCTVSFNDTARTEALFDPANTLSPLYGSLDGAQILIQAYNPVTGIWEPQFRGHIDQAGYDIPGSQAVTRGSLECVDILDYLAGCQMAPGLFGVTGPGGTIVYAETAGTIDDRFIEALTDAGIDSSMYVIFTGNVRGAEGVYDPGDSVLNVLRDGVSAEFPAVAANDFVDRRGRYCFHGRYARSDPDTVAATAGSAAWDFQRWKVGDGAAIALDSDTAQVRGFSFTRGRRDIINAALCWPRFSTTDTLFDQAEVPDNVVSDAASITAYGYHALPPAEDLLVLEGTTTGNTAKAECLYYGQQIVANLKDPLERVTSLVVKSLRSTDSRAAATWGVLTRADISDIMNVSVGYPGGVGVQNVPYYVEGYTKTIRPLGPDFDMIEADYNVSPAVWSVLA